MRGSIVAATVVIVVLIATIGAVVSVNRVVTAQEHQAQCDRMSREYQTLLQKVGIPQGYAQRKEAAGC